MAREALKAGDVFLDYRITEVIDAGGMGEVYKAVEDYSEDVVAIKCMSPRHVRREDFARRFRQECKFYPKLKHPNIVRMRKAGVSPDDVAYIVMDYLEGRTLRKVLNKIYRLDFLSAMHVMLQVADAMTFVHSKGIWHRDLKPENIMVGAKGDAKGHVWLLDFGIAKFADGGMNTDDLPDVGTVRYISPEQVKMLYGTSKKAERGEGARPDGRTDIYAFGAIFYEVLTGKHLFLDDGEPATAEETLTGHLVAAPEPVHELVPDCPEFVWPVVARCIAIDREERYPRFDEVARDLRGLLRDTVPAGHVLAQRLAQERMKAERQAAFAGVEMEEDSAPVAGEAEEARGEGEGEGGGMERGSEGEEEKKRTRRGVHGETAPLEQFVAPASALPFAPASRVPRGRGVGYTEPLPPTLPPLPVRGSAGMRGSAAPRETTAVLAGAWAERAAARGGAPGLPGAAAQYPAAPPPEVGAQRAVPTQQPPEVTSPYVTPQLRALAERHVPPPLPVTETQRAAPAPPPEATSPQVMPQPREVAAQYATPPLPMTEMQRAASLPPLVAGPPAAPSSVTAPSAQAPGSLQREAPRTPAAMLVQPQRATRVYVLAPLLALVMTVVGVGAALGIRAMSGAAPEGATGAPVVTATPAESVSASTAAASVVAPVPAPVPAAPAPEATASAGAVSTAEGAGEAGTPAKAEAVAEAEAPPSKEQPPAKEPPPSKAAPVRTAPAEMEDEEDIYAMPKRQKPSFLRVLSEEKKKAAPAKTAAPADAGSAKPKGPCASAGCRPF
ncbi:MULTISPECIES: serine/threonine-protein kinase [Sorangium]|uniref:Protein kinase n=1 Tax=Sorangium cellulosum TaxID=56 RepID=A0A4P2QG35_SORCE|nr:MULTISPECIES: serine/threonine-protein kinase [Sorangium]AUX28837.1 protein kinase [Sorangium cellulosum]WCQ88235.1 serine-threonine kinase [Sorangium sp. Soce836]